jgi:Heme/copper-type cytochrome/quinol oxidase, subunit 3
MVPTSLSAEREPEARSSPVLFGTVLFLASELLFFGGLFAAYFGLRAETTPWPPAGVHLETGLAAIATLFLLISSFTFHAGVTAGRRGRLGPMRRWIILTFALGVGFEGIQLADYLRIDFGISSNAYGTMYWAMTGLHGLHVLAGLALMLVLLGRLTQGAYRDGRVDGPHAISYYWHFVDVVWIGLFVTLFLLK